MAGLAATTGGALGLTENETQVRAAENNIISQSIVTPTEVGSTSSRALFAESVDVSMSPDRSLQITEGFHLGSTSIFEIAVTDVHGQRSEVATGTVKGLSNLMVNPYRAGQANITGAVEKNVERIAVYDKAGTILRYGQINADGTFRIYVSGFAAMQVVGDNFTVRALNSTGIIAQATATILP